MQQVQPKIFENVMTAGGCADPNVITYGTLRDMGYLKKEYRAEYGDPDNVTIIWTVVGDIILRDTMGGEYRKGDVIEWPK